MVPATTTTITGVTIFTKKRPRRVDVFDITLSHDGIDIKRPGRNEQHLGWDRISQWEIAEQAGYVVLTLRGDGAVTPLVVKGWTLDDLEEVMRDVTSTVTGPIPSRTMPPPPAQSQPQPQPTAESPTPRPGSMSAVTTPAAPVPPSPGIVPQRSDGVEASPSSPEPRAARRQRSQGRARGRPGWRTVVTVALLCALAAAVTLVLLQSAGVISWGFLGPTA